MNIETKEAISNVIEVWIKAAKLAIEVNSAKKWPTCELNHSTIRVERGRKYIRLVTTNLKGENGSVFCFIDQEGNIYKPAGYKAPAKGIRGNVMDVDPSKLDGATGWLYRR